MNALDERIRAHIDSLAMPVTLDEVTDPDPLFKLDAPAHRRWPIATIAAGVVAIAGLAAVATIASRDVDESSSGTPVSPTQTEPLRLGTWVRVEDSNAVFVASDEFDRIESGDGYIQSTSSVRVSGVVEFAGEYVAVGAANVGFRAEASVWRSPDGQTWTRVAAQALSPDLVTEPTDHYGLSIDAAVADGNRIVAVGVTTTNGARSLTSWTSADAVNWERHALDGLTSGPFVSVTGVVATADGFLATGFDNADPETGQRNESFLLRSSDGATWDRAENAEFAAPGVFVNGITSFGDRVIAYGATDGHAGNAAAWYSDDNGGTWTRSSVHDTSALPTSSITHSITAAETLVLVGEQATAEPGFDDVTESTATQRGDQDIAMWTSTDGASYQPVDTAPINSAALDRATAVTSGVTGVLIAADRDASAGTTTHIWEWHPSRGFIEQDHGELASVTTLTALPDGYLATASDRHFRDRDPNDTSDTSGEDTLVWVLPTS